jgi:hypothetical protein
MGASPQDEPTNNSPLSRLLDTARTPASVVAPLLLGALFGLLMGWTSFAAVLATVTGETVRTTASVPEEPEAFLPLLPDDLKVRFVDQQHGKVTTLVPVRGLPDRRPSQVQVEYSVSRPEWARCVDYDGRWVGAGAAALVMSGGLAMSAWRGWWLWRRAHEERAAARGDLIRSARYVLTQDEGSDWVLVVFTRDGDVAPDGLLVLADAQRGRIPTTGTVELRGALEEGRAVIATLHGNRLDLASPWLVPDEEDLLALINGYEEV